MLLHWTIFFGLVAELIHSRFMVVDLVTSCRLLATKCFGHVRLSTKVVNVVGANAKFASHLPRGVAIAWRIKMLQHRLRPKPAVVRRLDFAVFNRLVADIPTVLGHGADRAEAIGGVWGDCTLTFTA